MNKTNQIITDDHTLKEFNNKCLKQKVLAIDTEFIRDNTYYPILSLVQIAGEDFAAAIDPLSNINMKPIWELLTNENILKVFHSGRQDIEIFLFESKSHIGFISIPESGSIAAAKSSPAI